VSLYEPRGDYQLIVELMEDAGVGALQRAFEELKARLAAEGLFAPERKRPLPTAPRCIGIITSPTGAAVRDILHILARRYPCASVLIYPTPVQGAAAVGTLIAALDLAGRHRQCDVLILARGGGSLEDLWAFNDEGLARAILRCPIPVITGIGHEIDFTIADFVADVRAPTPSGAAQLAAPDAAVWRQRLAQLGDRFAAAARRTLRSELLRLETLAVRLRQAHPGARLQQHAQRLDELDARLRLALQRRLAAAAERQAQRCERVEQLAARLLRAIRSTLIAQGARLDGAARALNAVSPLATLDRGFAIVTRSTDGSLVTAASQLAVGETFDTRLASGSLRARVLEHRS
jgi:exodeoxyribonuclease VII large subunit